jgi:tetratricopeptide (TPR) repeat protein
MAENQVVEPQAEPKKQDLYLRHVEGFVKNAEEDFDQALDRYGFTVWHSLPAKQAAILKERLGVRPLGAFDLYNRGTACAMEGKWADAEGHLRAALKMEPENAAAAFNLSVCLEKLGRFDDARAMYGNYMKILDRARGRRDAALGTEGEIAQELARVQQHIESFGKS